MPEEIDYAARIQRGAALLDEKWPTWAQDIDLDKLDIESGTACMTAQYSAAHGGDGFWGSGRTMLELDMAAYENHGFRTDDDSQADYPTLNTLWRNLINERRSAAQSEASER